MQMAKNMSQKLTNMSLNLAPLSGVLYSSGDRFAVALLPGSKVVGSKLCPWPFSAAAWIQTARKSFRLAASYCSLSCSVTDAVLHRAQTRNFQATHTQHPPPAQKFLRPAFLFFAPQKAGRRKSLVRWMFPINFDARAHPITYTQRIQIPPVW